LPGLSSVTYQTLYRKYRSQTFADLVGQEATRRALQGAIASDRVSHAYLFSGTRGTGKTSTARLLAKAVNCLRRPAGSYEAFNALLKTLEEPPPHVMFVLCTTESNKVPLTVLGRCQQFVFRRFSDEQIAARLAFIAEREEIVLEAAVLELIARVAQGSMRD